MSKVGVLLSELVCCRFLTIFFLSQKEGNVFCAGASCRVFTATVSLTWCLAQRVVGPSLSDGQIPEVDAAGQTLRDVCDGLQSVAVQFQMGQSVLPAVHLRKAAHIPDLVV